MLSSIIFMVFTAITGYSIGMTNGKYLGEEKAIVSVNNTIPQTNHNENSNDNSPSEKDKKDDKKGDKKDDNNIKKSKNDKVVRKTPSKSSSPGRSSGGSGSSGGGSVSIPNKLKDGEYFGESNGFAGPVKVKVVVSGGKIKDVSVVSHTETPSYFDKAIAVASKIVSAQSTNVDSVSGATITSDAIKRAVGQALKNAGDSSGGGSSASSSDSSSKISELTKKIDELNKKIQDLTLQKDEVKLGELKDGKYEGEGQGFKGQVKVSVTVEKGKIKSIDILSDGGDDAPYFDKAKAIISDMLSKQTTKVDGVSGATYSSNGIKLAVNSALRKAGGGGKVDDAELKALNDNIKKLTEEKEKYEAEAKSLKSDLEKKNAEIDRINSNKTLKDGVYDGNSKGYDDRDFSVRVTVEKSKIKTIKVTKSSEDEKYFKMAEVLIQRIIEKNSASVDSVSGATFSSDAIKNGVRDALKKAYGEDGGELIDLEKIVESLKKLLLEKDEEIEILRSNIKQKDEEIKKKDELINSGTGMSTEEKKEETKQPKNGEFFGKVKGHKSDIEVKVVMKDDKIVSIDIQKNGDDEEFEELAKPIISLLLDSSKFESVTNVYKEYYKLSEQIIGKNFEGLPLSISSKLGKIKHPESTTDENAYGILTNSVSKIVREYLSKSDPSNKEILDVTSGATRTAAGIVSAVQDAINK